MQGELAGRELVLHGRQDAMNGWARNGARLVVMNAEETPFDVVADSVVREQLATVLPEIAAEV